MRYDKFKELEAFFESCETSTTVLSAGLDKEQKSALWLGFKAFKAVLDDVQIDAPREDPCKCEEYTPTLVNYDAAFHDGIVICKNCGKFIRDFDAG